MIVKAPNTLGSGCIRLSRLYTEFAFGMLIAVNLASFGTGLGDTSLEGGTTVKGG